ncbi:MAG: FAD-dependent oxidoreductase [Gammaproteobacteria bacterium]|nr:FAD-dependent oxidoreductase [Gammaproteobacteria bacterium]
MAAPQIAALDGMHFDVAIIGAGINGASAAQHLSAAGYRVLVVDRGDFANGATSRSSRLLHCGLRHLATGSNFWPTMLRPDNLVRSVSTARADMQARDEIVRTIPDRLRSINFCLPIYTDDAYAPWQLDAAFALLRMMSPTGVPLDYRRYNRNQLDQVPVTPWLRDPDALKSVAVFREYLFDWPERVALDALFDARRLGAQVNNYTRVEELERLESRNHWRLSLRSMKQEGESRQSINRSKVRVTADLVLNLAGAWVDDVIGETGYPVETKCAGIKGIHISVRLPDEFADWGIFAFNSIGEPLYCLPSNGMHYIGLTRTAYNGAVEDVSATDQEIDWMITETNRCLPQLAITRNDILFSWAGVNPLTSTSEDPLGSREIKIHDLAIDGVPGMLTLTGGAIMTHRRVATQLLRAVSSRVATSRSPQDLNFHWSDKAGEQDTPRINSEAFSVSTAAVERCARDEQPGSLTDLLMRRLGAGWCSDQGLALARPVAEAAAKELGWSKTHIDAEIRAYERHLKTARRRPGNISN